MNPISFIFDEKASHSNPGKTRQGMTRHGKARRGEARRGKTRRRPDKKVSPGFEKYCRIGSIVQWNEAWRIYMYIALKNPTLADTQKSDLALAMIQYMHHINHLHSRRADFLFYDTNFRQYLQYNPTPFSAVDHCLVTEAQSRGQSHANHSTPHFTQRQHSAMPRPPATSQPRSSYIAEARAKLRGYQIPTGYCYVFLAALPCYEGKCLYKHLCPWCNARHSADRCTQVAKHSTQNSSRGRGIQPLMSTFSPHKPTAEHHPMRPGYKHWQSFGPTHSISKSACDAPPAISAETKSVNVPRQSAPPVINYVKFANFLTGYDPVISPRLFSGFAEGFSLGHNSPYVDSHTNNLASAVHKPDIMETLIASEVAKGRFLGPFSQKPFSVMRINPVGFCPKKDPRHFSVDIQSISAQWFFSQFQHTWLCLKSSIPSGSGRNWLHLAISKPRKNGFLIKTRCQKCLSFTSSLSQRLSTHGHLLQKSVLHRCFSSHGHII